MMEKLSKELHQKVQKLAAKGDSLADRDRFEEAIPIYEAAWKMLPEPREDWEAGLWLISAIADSYFHLGKFSELLEVCAVSAASELAQDSAFFQLRYGQALFEVGQVEKGKEHLELAQELGGDEIFEDEDEKYQLDLT